MAYPASAFSAPAPCAGIMYMGCANMQVIIELHGHDQKGAAERQQAHFQVLEHEEEAPIEGEQERGYQLYGHDVAKA